MGGIFDWGRDPTLWDLYAKNDQLLRPGGNPAPNLPVLWAFLATPENRPATMPALQKQSQLCSSRLLRSLTSTIIYNRDNI